MIPSNAAPAGAYLLSRLQAAVAGGYLLASALAVFLATVLPASRAEAVLAGMQWSFALHVLAVIWAFSPVSPSRVWLGLLLLAAFLVRRLWLGSGACDKDLAAHHRQVPSG
ncbi:DUF3649 domain-containing protein [Comamonas thiooxydans]|uniref:DUF3649 domain-containing protein n=1 Tax=Comamonas thiooxydans TaxID=363952 RepID=UPI00050E1568|nr:DUF3649 domain-containing protein [Comamonas thiooxydans]KGG85367.1 hypothetical protein P609_14290 [Comamonas thiooxydans]